MVFPNPISSAKIPLILFSCKVTNQSSPMCWYSRKVCWIKKGILVLTVEADRFTPVGWNFSAHWAACVIIMSSESTTSYLPDSFFCTIIESLSWMSSLLFEVVWDWLRVVDNAVLSSAFYNWKFWIFKDFYYNNI